MMFGKNEALLSLSTDKVSHFGYIRTGMHCLAASPNSSASLGRASGRENLYLLFAEVQEITIAWKSHACYGHHHISDTHAVPSCGQHKAGKDFQKCPLSWT